MKILVTGAAGFIGSKTAMMLAERGDEVIGVDNINEYYDVRLKYGRLCELLGVGHSVQINGNDSLTPYSDLPFGVYYHSKKLPNLCAWLLMTVLQWKTYSMRKSLIK